VRYDAGAVFNDSMKGQVMPGRPKTKLRKLLDFQRGFGELLVTFQTLIPASVDEAKSKRCDTARKWRETRAALFTTLMAVETLVADHAGKAGVEEDTTDANALKFFHEFARRFDFESRSFLELPEWGDPADYAHEQVSFDWSDADYGEEDEADDEAAFETAEATTENG
jgi:hypothetical protein